MTVSGLTGGNAEQGDPVTVNLGTSLSDVIYTWLLNGQVVLGDSTDSYTPAYADQGKTLDVVVSFTDPTTGNTDQVTGVAGTVQAEPERPPLEQFRRRELDHRYRLDAQHRSEQYDANCICRRVRHLHRQYHVYSHGGRPDRRQFDGDA